MGAVTVAIKRRDFTDAGRVTIADVTGSSSYATGGDTFTKAQFEALGQIDAIVDCGATGYVLVPDIPNLKIKYMRPGVASTPLVEETAATNLTTIVTRVIIYHSNPYI